MNRRLWWIPLAGAAAFTFAYFYAASLYPGGTRFDHDTVGYSHLANYWCDLLAGTSYSGVANAARPIALIATVLFPLSLIPLWLTLPRLFGAQSHHAALARTVRVGGLLGMLGAASIGTSMHDLAIHLATAAGAVTLVALLLALVNAGRARLAIVGGVASVIGGLNYLMWATGSGAHILPGTQKAAYVACLVWTVQLTLAAHRAEASALSR